MYLPPDDRRAASEAYVDDSQRHEGPVYVGCDLNMQAQRPRNNEEQDVAVRICEEWQRRGSSPAIQGKDTRREGRSRVELDYIIAENAVAWKCAIEVKWTGESDHAWLNSRTQPNMAGGRACTPSTVSSLPNGMGPRATEV